MDWMSIKYPYQSCIHLLYYLSESYWANFCSDSTSHIEQYFRFDSNNILMFLFVILLMVEQNFVIRHYDDLIVLIKISKGQIFWHICLFQFLIYWHDLNLEAKTRLLDSRSVITSFMTNKVRQIDWTLLFQTTGEEFVKQIDWPEGTHEFPLLRVHLLCAEMWMKGEKSIEGIHLLCAGVCVQS